MSKRTRITLVAAGALLLAQSALAAPNAHENGRFCQKYAANAVHAFQDATREPRCHDLLADQNVWNGDTKHHVDWCMQTPPKDVDAAERSRHQALETCIMAGRKPR